MVSTSKKSALYVVDNSNNDSSSGDITTATLSSISASYSQGDRVIYPSTDLVDLKIGLNYIFILYTSGIRKRKQLIL